MPSTPAEQYLGMVAPYDLALDRELWRWLPASVDLLLTRTPDEQLPVSVQQARLLGDAGTIAAATRAVLTPGPGVVVYACTAGSFVNGHAGEQAIVAAMLAAGAPRAITTSGAAVRALERLGCRRVAIATPYDRPLTGLLVEYFAECGLEVVGSAQLGLERDIWRVPASTTEDLVRRVRTADCDAVFVSCTNLPTFDLLAGLEAELGVPVVSANQATMWAALEALGVSAVGPGQRLVEAGPPAATDAVGPPEGAVP